MMNRRRPERLAGAGFATAAPPAGECASAPEGGVTGMGKPEDDGAVIARDAVAGPGSGTLGLSSIREIRPRKTDRSTERFGHLLLT